MKTTLTTKGIKMKSSILKAGIVVAALVLALTVVPNLGAADNQFPSEDEIQKEVLAKVKEKLLEKLKGRGYEDLAGKLGGLNPEKIGDFLGSAAGGDFNHAFQIAGEPAANYLYDKFKGQLSGKLDEIIQPGSPAANMMKYIPWNAADGKQIAIKLLNGDYSGASNQLTSMVKKEGVVNLKTMSKDIVAYGIDWVLKPTVGAGGGALFVKAVELETAGIEWFKQYSSTYLSSDVQVVYDNARKNGNLPNSAFQTASKAQPRVILGYPFNAMTDKQIVQYLEGNYAKSKGILPQSFESRRKREAQKITDTLDVELQKRQEEYSKNVKQELLRIFTEAANSSKELKELIGKSKAARDKINAIKAETKKLANLWRKQRSIYKTENIEKQKRAYKEKLVDLEKNAKGANLENCRQINGWIEKIEEKLDAVNAKLERVQEIGHESQGIVKKICDHRNDKALVEKGMIALKKRFGYIGALKNEMGSLKTEVVGYLGELEKLKADVKSLLDKQQRLQSSLNSIDRWQKVVDATQKSVDTSTQTVNELHADVRQIVTGNPVFNRFQGQAGSIRYTLIKDADSAKKKFDKQKGTIETALKKMSDSLKGLDEVKDRLNIQKEALDRKLGDCRKLQDVNVTQYQRRIQKMGKTYNRYRKGFKKLSLKAKDCMGEMGNTASKIFDEARRLLKKARERGDEVIDKYLEADNTIEGLSTIQASASDALANLSKKEGHAADLIDSCAQAQGKAKLLKSEIEAAIATSSVSMAVLKKGYTGAANARKLACEAKTAAKGAKSKAECENAVAEAHSQAATAKEASKASSHAAEKMKSLYGRMKSKSDLKSFDELLRKIPQAIESLENQVAEINTKIDNIDADSIRSKINKAQSAAEAAHTYAQKVFGLVGQIKGLLAGIDSELAAEAKKLLSEADIISGVAESNDQKATMAAADAKTIGEKAIAMIMEAKAKIKEMSASKKKLERCRNVDTGGSLNDLRTNSDMGEIFGPGAEAAAESAVFCAQSATVYCNKKASCGPKEERNTSGNCICVDGYKRVDGVCKKSGCTVDSDCLQGYVCNTQSGRCVSPFDENYTSRGDLMASNEQNRQRTNDAQNIADANLNPNDGKFTSSGLSDDIDKTQNFVSAECNDRKPCPAGHTCQDGKCVDEHNNCTSNDDCAKGQECKDGTCVALSDAKPKSLTVSPANKAVKINEAVTLKAILTNKDGTTKDVSHEAKWSPGNPFSNGDIGQYTVKASYKDLSGTAMITVVKEKGMDDIAVNSKIITVTFFDHGQEDGDMIDILINGKAVFSGITLTKAPQSRTITMNADIIVFGFRALNEGKIPPNTASVSFTSVTKGKSSQTYELKKNQKTNMNITYSP